MSPLRQTLAERLRAPGGDPRLRCLCLFHGAAAIGRFDAVEALLELSSEIGIPRLELAEAALQVVAYGGFPRAIETFSKLAGLPRDAAPVAGTDALPEEIDLLDRGRETFRRVYGTNTEKVLAQLDDYQPGLASHVLQDAYGRILSRPGLPLGEREMLAVAALALAALPLPLESHMRGALANGFQLSAIEDILSTSFVLADEGARTVISQALVRLSKKVLRP